MIFSQTQRARVVNNSSERQVTVTTTRTISPGWCLSTLAILKWFEIICCVVIIAVLQPYIYAWAAYSYIIFVASSCLMTTIILLMIYFLQLHHGALKTLPWRAAEVTTNILELILFLFAFAIGIYDCVQLFRNSQSHHPVRYHTDIYDLRNRMAAVTAFMGANCIFYLLSAIYARNGYL